MSFSVGQQRENSMTMDFARLRAAVYNSAKRAFIEVHESHPSERFYAFALYTDDGVMGISPSANSEEGYQRMVGNYRAMFGETSPAELRYLRWATAEWAYEAAGQEHFHPVHSLLTAVDRYGPEEEDGFVAFKSQVLTTMVEALQDLDADGLFGSGEEREKVTLFISISDSGVAEQVEDESARKLNPESVYARFRARYQQLDQI